MPAPLRCSLISDLPPWRATLLADAPPPSRSLADEFSAFSAEKESLSHSLLPLALSRWRLLARAKENSHLTRPAAMVIYVRQGY